MRIGRIKMCDKNFLQITQNIYKESSVCLKIAKMKVSIQNVLIFFTTVFIHITNARYCPNMLDPYANWHHHNTILEGPKFKLDDCHNNYLIGNTETFLFSI